MPQKKQLSFKFCPICGAPLETGRMEFPIPDEDEFGSIYHRIGSGYYDAQRQRAVCPRMMRNFSRKMSFTN